MPAMRTVAAPGWSGKGLSRSKIALPIYWESQLSCVDQNNPTVPGLAKTLAAASWRDEGPYVIDSKR
jgi:hypothetical protein